jgi:hypothetical protein
VTNVYILEGGSIALHNGIGPAIRVLHRNKTHDQNCGVRAREVRKVGGENGGTSCSGRKEIVKVINFVSKIHICQAYSSAKQTKLSGQ